MKKSLALVLSLALTLSLSLPAFAFSGEYHAVPLIYETDAMPDLQVPPLETPPPFTDCADKVVALAWACGLVNGCGGEFRPLDTLTKAEWAQMLHNAFGPRFPREPRPAGKPWYYQATTWLGLDDSGLADPASYDWCIKTAYKLWCRGGEIEFDAGKAPDWALTYGAGPTDGWRTLSNIGAASGQYFTRAEAVYLLITLGELELNPLS